MLGVKTFFTVIVALLSGLCIVVYIFDAADPNERSMLKCNHNSVLASVLYLCSHLAALLDIVNSLLHARNKTPSLSIENLFLILCLTMTLILGSNMFATSITSHCPINTILLFVNMVAVGLQTLLIISVRSKVLTSAAYFRLGAWNMIWMVIDIADIILAWKKLDFLPRDASPATISYFRSIVFPLLVELRLDSTFRIEYLQHNHNTKEEDVGRASNRGSISESSIDNVVDVHADLVKKNHHGDLPESWFATMSAGGFIFFSFITVFVMASRSQLSRADEFTYGYIIFTICIQTIFSSLLIFIFYAGKNGKLGMIWRQDSLQLQGHGYTSSFRKFLLTACTIAIVIWELLTVIRAIYDPESREGYWELLVVSDILEVFTILLQFFFILQTTVQSHTRFRFAFILMFVGYNLLWWVQELLVESNTGLPDDARSIWYILDNLLYPFAVEYRFQCAMIFFEFF